MSLVLLVLLSPLFMVIAVCIKVTSKGPVFFRQERIGRGFRPFYIYKFRTMYANTTGPSVTLPDDKRVTPIGRFLRRYKVDEWPQLLNVIRNEMSFIGPRPELSRYIHKFTDDYRRVLSVKPGISDPVSIAFRNETNLLRSLKEQEAENYYLETLLPKKLEMYRNYLDTMSFLQDLWIIVKSILVVFFEPDRS